MARRIMITRFWVVGDVGDRDVRRLVLAAGVAALLTGCGSAAQTAKNPVPTTSTPRRVHEASVGDVIVLSGVDDPSGTGTLRLAVKVNNVVSTAVGRGAFEKPRTGERFAAVRFVFKNIGATAYRDSPTFGAKVVDASGHGYDPTVATVSAGPGFPRVMSLPHGRSRSGYFVFAIPKKARIVGVQYALNAGDAPELGEWHVPRDDPAPADVIPHLATAAGHDPSDRSSRRGARGPSW